MKHFILLFFAATLLCQGQIINFPDPNFKNALVNHSPVIDTNGDGEIQISEAEALYSYLSLNERNISDLTGIEYFINITELYCTNNNLTAIDLSSLTDLKIVFLNDNQLAEIDISNLTNLEFLWINNNLLTDLSFVNQINLFSVRCSSNQLTELEINGDNFFELDCSNNLITDLTINAPVPDYWQRLNCSGNLLTNLDLSNSSVGILDCSDNPDLVSINWRTGWNYKYNSTFDLPTKFQNLPNLSSVCIDSYNQELMDFILTEVGHSVDFYNNETCDALSVNENNLGELTITPNPAENSINIEANTQINQIEIYNELGQLVQSNVLTISTRQTDLDISALRQGLYFVKVADENGTATIKKVIKE